MSLGSLVESNEILQDPAALRGRLEEDGYLFFRGVLDTDKLAALRLEILTVLQRHGWLMAGSDPMDGIADIRAQCTEGDLAYAAGYHDMYRLESFHRSGHWPEIMDVLDRIIDGDVLPHPAKIARLWFPKYTEHTTPVHQDFVHFQGCHDTYTCWSPVGDCPVELGGLAVLRGSHRVDRVLDHHFSLGAGSLMVRPEDLHGDWLTTDYRSGDTLIFNALMVHQALPNVTEDKFRVSLDNRYVAAHRPIAEQMLKPHLEAHDNFTWEQVYADWEAEDLQYYWHQHDLDVIPMNPQWKDVAVAEAIDLVTHEDNAHARHYLSRLVARNPDSDDARRAAIALALT